MTEWTYDASRNRLEPARRPETSSGPALLLSFSKKAYAPGVSVSRAIRGGRYRSDALPPARASRLAESAVLTYCIADAAVTTMTVHEIACTVHLPVCGQ